MDSMRILDQHIDRSLWPVEPAEAAKYQFIWTGSAPRRAEADCPRRLRPGEDDECTLAESRRSSQTTGGGTVLQTCWRGVRAPRKQMKKLLSKGKAPTGEKMWQQDGVRRWSETTLVESERQQGEGKEMEK